MNFSVNGQHGNRFIGLDGGQGSGKSTYARNLIERLEAETGAPVVYIETDDFLSEREWRMTLSTEFYDDVANRRKLWDFERMSEIIGRLKQSGGAVITVDGLYNRTTGKRDRTTTWDTTASKVVLVAGPLLLEPELEDLFDELLFLDAPEDERMRRVLKRNEELGRDKNDALRTFHNFEKFYMPYWSERMDRYDQIIPN